MKFLHKKFEYELAGQENTLKIEDVQAAIYTSCGKDRFKLIKSNDREITLKYLDHTRIGDIRVDIMVQEGKLVVEMYEHFTAYILFLYLIIIGVIGCVYGVLFNEIGFLFLAVFAYFLWILLDNFYDLKKELQHALEHTVTGKKKKS